MLIGEFYSPLGDKNRVALPKKLREQLGDKLLVTRGYEGCVLVVDEQHWQKLIDDVNRSPLLNLSVRDTKRFLLGGAHEVELDGQGRFVMPESLINYANLSRDLVFLGVGEWIEIWPQTGWEQKLNYLKTDASDIADRLSNV